MRLSDDGLSTIIKDTFVEPIIEDFCSDEGCPECNRHKAYLDLQDARQELAELRAWREQVFLVVRQIESARDELLYIMESLKK